MFPKPTLYYNFILLKAHYVRFSALKYPKTTGTMIFSQIFTKFLNPERLIALNLKDIPSVV